MQGQQNRPENFPGMQNPAEKYALNDNSVRDFISRFGGVVLTARNVQEERTFPDDFSALRAALDYFYPLSIIANLAFSGVVYRTADKKTQYAFSGSVVCTGTRTIQYSPVKIRNCVSAFWRTSGQANISSRYFANDETRLADKYRIPFFLCNRAGMLKRFQPGDSTLSADIAYELMAIQEPGFALGNLVNDKFGRIISINPQLQQMHFRHYEELDETPVSMTIASYAK